VSRRGGSKVQSGSVASQRDSKFLIRLFQTQEHLVRFLFVLEVRWVERLDEIEIEVPGRYGGGSLVGCAEKEIALARGFSVQPFQFVLPDPVTRHVGWTVRDFHDALQGFVIVAIELCGVEAFSSFLDQGVEVIRFLEVKVVLPVVVVGGDELPAYGFMDLPQDGFHLR